METKGYPIIMADELAEKGQNPMALGQPEIRTPMAVPKKDIQRRSFLTNLRRMLAAVGLGTLVIGAIDQAIPDPTKDQSQSGNQAPMDTRDRIYEDQDPDLQAKVIGQRKNEQIVIPGNSNAAGTLTDNPPIRKH